MNEDLIGILHDACRLCGARAAQLSVADVPVARWPVVEEGGLVEIASTPFRTPSGTPTLIRLYAPEARTLSDIQAIVLTAYAEHASLTLA